jgi:hypothetical protein
MSNLRFKPINPIKYPRKSLDLLKQLNPKLKSEAIEKNRIATIKRPIHNCFGLFVNNKLIGISGEWVTARIYCGKQLQLDNMCLQVKILLRLQRKY